jgi:hypothetical protein
VSDALLSFDDEQVLAHQPTGHKAGQSLSGKGLVLQQDDVEPWCGFIEDDETNTLFFSGPTPLIAAMRCYVASKMGDEIELPEEVK